MRQILLLIAALMLSIYSGYELFYSKSDNKNNSASGRIASLDKISNLVRHKRSGNLSWEESYEGIGLFAQDMIFTGEKSSTILVTKSNVKIFVTPNTLLVLREKGGVLDLNLKQGVVDIVFKKMTNIFVGGKSIKHISGKSILRMSKGNLKMLKGAIKVNGANLDTKTMITSIKPESGQRFIIGENDKINFTWISKINFTDYEVHIQRIDQDKAKIIEHVQKSELKRMIGSGQYYWQIIASRNGKTFKSEKNYFHVKVVLPDLRLVDFKPSNRALIKFSYDRNLDINFSWKHILLKDGKRKEMKSDNFKYLFSIYKKEENKVRLIKKVETKLTNINYGINIPGVYIWTVTPIGHSLRKYRTRRNIVTVDSEMAPAPIIEENIEVKIIDGYIDE